MAKVQEVQWSNFGEQGGFGSYSDFFAVLPPDSAPQVGAIALASHPEVDLHHSKDSVTLVTGSNELEHSEDNASFFDLQQPDFETRILQAEAPALSSTVGHEEQASGQYQSAYMPIGAEECSEFDKNSSQNVHAYGQEQSVQGYHFDQIQMLNAEAHGQAEAHDQVQQTELGEHDYGQWQELAEYPGWLYNAYTKEWKEKNSGGSDAVTVNASDYSSEQVHVQDSAEERQTTDWQVNETVPTGQDGFSQLGRSSLVQNDWAGGSSENGKVNATHNQQFVDTVKQNVQASLESTRQVATSQAQTSWEEQYPGWFFDYQTNEWKQYSESPQIANENAPLLPDKTQQSASFVAYDEPNHSNTISQGYYSGHHTQDTRGNQDKVPVSLLTNNHSSSQAQSVSQWTGHNDQQFFYPSTNHQYGQLGPNEVKKQADFMHPNWDVPYNSQINQMPEIPHTQYSTPQVPGYMPRPWMPSNEHNHYVPNASQTPPKSVEEALRSSVGRPPHVLASFGFGGKLAILKMTDPVSLQFSNGNQSFSSGQAFVSGPVHVHNLSQLVAQNGDIGRGESGSLYFGALNRSSLSGPLVGGSFSSKELSKWLEDRAANCQCEEPDSRSPVSLLMLWGLLKLACKHYGKLRSAAGSAGFTSQEDDGPEAALSQVLNSGGDQSSWTMGSLASSVCLQPMPSEHQLQVTAAETKKLLVAGKRKEALKHAQQGQLWGPALVLARQLGEKIYADTVAEMAQRQFLPGSPLRTLSLLLAGQPADVFSGNVVNPSPLGVSTEAGLESMLENWQENLSIMAANRTSGDDRVISHLGDCLWKVKGEVASAHICYLVADVNFESFSSNARLCLIGADHWKNPRTYASPEAIQRTEVFEYSKVLGNPQYILVPFQPYKLIYASMLAEAGKTNEALRYCQAVLKTLKTAGRAPTVETCRLAATSLEERLRGHAQGGYSGNLGPGMLKGIFKAIDNRIHGIIGGPPPYQAQEQVLMGGTEESLTLHDHLSIARISTSPRSSAPLGPSASAEKINEPGRYMPQRSVSEPDFSSTMKEKADQGKPTTRGGYLGRFGSVFSKAGGIVSLVSKSSKNEAKLGDTNKFYYDEKLKKWVEEGAAAPQEEILPPPPPTASMFLSQSEQPIQPDLHHGMGVGISSGSKSSAHLGTPPVPPSNQFSARSRQQGVRSRYVDTFNKGNSTPTKSAISTFAPVGRTGGTPVKPMNFFVPTPSSLDTSNGSVLDFNNGTTSGINEDKQVRPNIVSDTNDGMVLNQHSTVPNLSYQSGIVTSSMYHPNSENTSAFGTDSIRRVPSSEHTFSVGSGEAVIGSGKLAKGPMKSDIGLSNGYHSRANSWSGYPSNFQMLPTETNLSYDKSTTNFSMYNGFSPQSTINNTPSTVGSYFPSLPKVDSYELSNTSRMMDSFASPPPSMMPFTAANMSEFLPGPVETSQAAVSVAGDDLQEVEL